MFKFRARRGFSLLELMTTGSVLGILASVALPTFAHAQMKAKNGAIVANTHTVRLGVAQYGADHGGLMPTQIFGAAGDDKVLVQVGGERLGYLPGEKMPVLPLGNQIFQKTNIDVTHASLIKAADVEAN